MKFLVLSQNQYRKCTNPRSWTQLQKKTPLKEIDPIHNEYFSQYQNVLSWHRETASVVSSYLFPPIVDLFVPRGHHNHFFFFFLLLFFFSFWRGGGGGGAESRHRYLLVGNLCGHIFVRKFVKEIVSGCMSINFCYVKLIVLYQK